jgi:pimeloyl-ACP methyl ester carboxylesterase
MMQGMPVSRTAMLLAASVLLPLAGCSHDPRRTVAPGAEAAAAASMPGPGAGIRVLEPYDASRIPVLFIHGIGGTPRDFRGMIEALDRTRFQAWVFSYPTGLRLRAASRTLSDRVAELQQEHGFEALFIAAHSMGGLVSRGYLVAAQQDATGASVRVLVTFASPWEGVPWARIGARLTPGAPGAWIDLSPGSEFLVSLRAPLQHAAHHVFFAFRRGPSLLEHRSSDGAIALSSQLPQWLQEQAVRSWGYDAGHADILTDPAALRQFNLLLASEAERLRSGRAPAAPAR